MVVLEYLNHRQQREKRRGSVDLFKIHTLKSIGKALITKKSPYYVQFYINGQCNLKCKQCNIVETNSRIEQMSLEQVEKAASNMKKIGVGIVLLTGGEPFMHPNLPEIVRIFAKLGMDVRLQTAGTKYATNEKLIQCYESGARDINVSLDSLESHKSDYINSVPGSGDNAIDAIERISDIFRNESSILSFGTVLSRFNFREIPAILEFAKNIGWFVSLVPVHISNLNKPRGFRSFETDFNFLPSEFADLDVALEEIIRLKKQGNTLFDSERFLRSSVSFLKGNGPTWRHKGVCDSPNLYFAIRPNGAFTTCCDYTLNQPPVIYGDSFVKDYNSGNIQKRPDIQKIVTSCAGCHYGSYPEVTLSVRDWKAFIERTKIVFLSGRGRLKSATVKGNFAAEAQRIMAAHPEIYPTRNWQSESIRKKLDLWNSPDGQRELIKMDIETRKQQGRVRGQGTDTIIGPEPRS